MGDRQQRSGGYRASEGRLEGAREGGEGGVVSRPLKRLNSVSRAVIKQQAQRGSGWPLCGEDKGQYGGDEKEEKENERTCEEALTPTLRVLFFLVLSEQFWSVETKRKERECV